MSSIGKAVSILAGVVALIGFFGSAYIINEGEQAIITQFGKPVGGAITTAGLHFKIPVIQKVTRLEKRILTWDGEPEQIPTKDKKFIVVDTTARWRVSDPLKFIQTVENERGARNRLDTILDGVTRDTISNNNLVEAVRNSNAILEKARALRKQEDAAAKAEAGVILTTGGTLTEEEEFFGDLEEIVTGREKLSQQIVEHAGVELKELGIELIDVQLRRIEYEASVERKVFERMISERNRVAEKIRSIGKGEQAKIQGKTSRELQKIESEAYRKAQLIKGNAESQSIRIYAKALKRDPSFYQFLRTMDAYKESLSAKTDYILTTDSEFLKLLKKP